MYLMTAYSFDCMFLLSYVSDTSSFVLFLNSIIFLSLLTLTEFHTVNVHIYLHIHNLRAFVFFQLGIRTFLKTNVPEYVMKM
jgi:hypothetical protein